MPALRMGTDQDGQTDTGQLSRHRITPGGRALRHGRQVSAPVVVTRKAKPHWHDCDLRCIVEAGGRQPQPVSQPFAGWITERDAALPGNISGRLTGDQDSGAGIDL